MNPRYAAVQVLVQVIQQQKSLNEVLDHYLAQIQQSKDRALLQALCYGVIRYYYRLDFILGKLLKKKLKTRDCDIQCLLFLGLYQLIEMRVPDHAAVSESVAQVKALKKDWAKGLVNAILRQYQRDAEILQQQVNDNQVARYAHPQWLLDAFKHAWPDKWQMLIEANNRQAHMTLRVNKLQISRESYLNKLTSHGLDAYPTKYSDVGIVLNQAVNVDELPGFKQGQVSVQDAAAQLAANLLDPQPDEIVLDACAAPGGKTAHILELQPKLTELIALDISAQRLVRINENLERLGLKANVQKGDACMPQAGWTKKLFDRILVDAPCSATGVIRHHPDIKLLRKKSDIARLIAKQHAMLLALWPLLKPGGTMLYATCSVFPEENTQQVQRFIAAMPDAKIKPIVADWGHETEVGRQILSGEDDMDGFYYAKLEKPRNRN